MKSTIAIAALALTAALAPKGVAGPLPATSAESKPVPTPKGGAAPSDAPRIESFPVQGSSIERIRATIAVNAPIDRVRSVVFDYPKYPEFMPRYEKATVLRVTPEGRRLVQMELGGMVHMWMRVDISAPARSGATETYDGRFVSGNVKAFQPRWELEALGPDRTRVTMESFLDPGLPLVPSSMINSGARDGLRDAIVALKTRVEGVRVAAR